ncbi:MAG: hypothetical protein AAGU27_26875 [Dehalobacterium sp.]
MPEIEQNSVLYASKDNRGFNEQTLQINQNTGIDSSNLLNHLESNIRIQVNNNNTVTDSVYSSVYSPVSGMQLFDTSSDNKVIFDPNCNNSGLVEDVSASEPGPINNLKTWKLTKTGTANQWHGWESNYSGLFNCKAGEYWTISGYYKTANSAGASKLNVENYINLDGKVYIIQQS